MSRTFKKRILFNNGMFEDMERFTGNKMKAYCSLYHKSSLKFSYAQISYSNKEQMRNANRSLNKRTRQYNKQLSVQGILEWSLTNGTTTANDS